MGTQIIPLFPLSVVLLPAMPLPLHIFEDRYKEMMTDVISAGGEFGVVLVRDNGIVNVGCTATVVSILRRYPDGRLDLLTSGQRRFQIESLDEEKSYLRAAVEYFDDDDIGEVPPELTRNASAAYRLLMDLEDSSASEDEEPLKSARLSFQMAQFIADLDKRQTVLSLRSEVERLQYLVKIVPEYIARHEQIALAKRVGPLNGHAKHVML